MKAYLEALVRALLAGGFMLKYYWRRALLSFKDPNSAEARAEAEKLAKALTWHRMPDLTADELRSPRVKGTEK